MTSRHIDRTRAETRSPLQGNGHRAVRAPRQIKVLLIIGLFFLVLAILAQAPSSATAALYQPQATPTPNPNLSIGNDSCLECHGQPGLTMKLDNGEEIDLYVDSQEYDGSIHGKGRYACVQCHTTVGNYPHPPFTAADRRDASLKLFPACYRCHSGEYERSQDSVHAVAMAAGKREAAICTDCHTSHAVRQLNDLKTGQLLADTRTWIPQTCAQCHNEIYQKYQTSVHGSALIGEGNPDVPTCIDCHGVHDIANPLVNAFRLKSPEMCAKCHTDAKRMAKYGISTKVLTTYVADFHGTTVNIFEKESPDAPTNKPVCFDCHGVHDITRTDDPQKGLLVKENLLARCKVCHPDATANFPTAWLSHYIPSARQNSLVYYVGLFYKLLIPILIGGMALLVVMDFSRLTINRIHKDRQVHGAPKIEESPQPVEVVSDQSEAPTPLPEQETPPTLAELAPTTSQVEPTISEERLTRIEEPPTTSEGTPTTIETEETTETPAGNEGEPEPGDDTPPPDQPGDEEAAND